MISKREWYAALRRMLKRAALWFGGLFLMTALFYLRVWGLPLDAAVMATISASGLHSFVMDHLLRSICQARAGLMPALVFLRRTAGRRGVCVAQN